MISNILSLQPRIQFFLTVGQDIFGNKIPGIISRPACHICFIISFLCSNFRYVSTTLRVRKSNYFKEIHHNKCYKNSWASQAGYGILDVLKEFRLLEHTATHYLLTRDFIIGKKAHDCKLTMPLLLLLCLLPNSLDISRAVKFFQLTPSPWLTRIRFT